MVVVVVVIPLVDEGRGNSAYVAKLGDGGALVVGPTVHDPTPPPLAQLDLAAFDAAVADGAETVDVRQASGFVAGHVPWARNVELGAVSQPSDEIPDTALMVHCGHGERAMSAASLLQRAGHTDVAVLAGGSAELGKLEIGYGT